MLLFFVLTLEIQKIQRKCETAQIMKRTREKDDQPTEIDTEIDAVTKKRIRKPVETLNISVTVKKKEIVQGNGIPLKDIPAIAKEIKTYPAFSYHYYMESLHNLLYGFAGTNKSRRQNILNFSGYPQTTNRETKFNSLLSNVKYTYNRCGMIRKFLEIFQLPTNGSKEELFNRLLDFLFNPQRAQYQ